MTGDPGAASTAPVAAPTRQTLYEEPALWVVGWTLPTYWRPATATVRIGDQVEKGLHLLQVWMIRPMGGEEVLVSIRRTATGGCGPLAPEGARRPHSAPRSWSGPVEVDGRPIVKLTELAFDPKARTFSLGFERGGTATMRMADARSATGTRSTSPSTARVAGRPFAALRSMYVTDFNNDVARIAVREKGAKGWREEAIMSFQGASPPTSGPAARRRRATTRRRPTWCSAGFRRRRRARGARRRRRPCSQPLADLASNTWLRNQ